MFELLPALVHYINTSVGECHITTVNMLVRIMLCLLYSILYIYTASVVLHAGSYHVRMYLQMYTDVYSLSIRLTGTHCVTLHSLHSWSISAHFQCCKSDRDQKILHLAAQCTKVQLEFFSSCDPHSSSRCSGLLQSAEMQLLQLPDSAEPQAQALM
jgi:hypothetical protein